MIDHVGDRRVLCKRRRHTSGVAVGESVLVPREDMGVAPKGVAAAEVPFLSGLL